MRHIISLILGLVASYYTLEVWIALKEGVDCYRFIYIDVPFLFPCRGKMLYILVLCIIGIVLNNTDEPKEKELIDHLIE